ncbi:hypothetical protein RND71_024950 [Anisodus tanguticus]|uniref:Uncharacterized protein n=1 Tax=Anisodus tanguticus TaxID=243964 RepID=A0AAE1RP32_9SOLA|nr:hypothetical protein RND71_024950 [Anisodus tanguticus]
MVSLEQDPPLSAGQSLPICDLAELIPSGVSFRASFALALSEGSSPHSLPDGFSDDPLSSLLVQNNRNLNPIGQYLIKVEKNQFRLKVKEEYIEKILDDSRYVKKLSEKRYYFHSSMAAETERVLRKRKRNVDGKINRKLDVDQQVEVRSVEDGFLGSWHSGTVIGCDDLIRRVKYDHLLCDDGSGNLVELVSVSPMVDGVIIPADQKLVHRGGVIRPLPPLREFGKWPLTYGQCVDYYYQDAWWEGVIFDREEGDEERRIFFPEMGDEMKAQVDRLRITQDWDEVTEEWEPRGSWIFLEMIEEIEQLHPRLISVKQIWYEVQLKNEYDAFLKLWWTSSSTDIWRKLVKEVLHDNTKLSIKQFFSQLNSSQVFVEGGQLLEFSDLSLVAKLNLETYFDNSISLFKEAASKLDSTATLTIDQDFPHLQLPMDQDVSEGFAPASKDVQLRGNGESIPPSQKEESYVPPPSDDAGILSSTKSKPPTFTNSKPRRGRPPAKKKNPEAIVKYMSSVSSMKNFRKPPSDDISGILSSTKSEPPTFKPRRGRPPTKKKKIEGQNLVSEPDSCPEALIAKYVPSTSSVKEFKKHLLYLGWKFELVMDCGIIKKNYVAPNGKVCESLSQVCQMLEESEACGPVPPVEQSSLYESTDNSIQSPPCMEGPQTCREVPELLSPSTEETIIDPEISRRAVIDYCSPQSQERGAYQKLYNLGVKIRDTSLKAKKHLAATGWKFYTIGKKDKKLCFRSPEGKMFISLRKACKWCVKKWEAESYLPEQVSSPSLLSPLREEPLQNGKSKFYNMTKPRKKRNHGDVKDTHTGGLPGKKPSLKKGDGIGSHSSTCVMLSSKRARKVAPSSSNQTPRTVLSWLIDNNVVLPRAKVQYCGKKYGNPMAEGRITREGIKCNCCQKVFGLRNFETHAGSSCHKPSANIFLEDGRSLLECQMQMKRKQCVKTTTKEPCAVKKGSRFSTNDYICSVCHYGGELILCDECPSSFHPNCLEMKLNRTGSRDEEIIYFATNCLNRRFQMVTGFAHHAVVKCVVRADLIQTETTLQITPFSFVVSVTISILFDADHARCLRSKGPGKLDNYPEGNWFCNKRCELIFLGMNHLLGKPIIVGDDNLTWTLLKYIEPDDSGSGIVDYESSVENYSRLSVALNVMHECFEPVKEPHTRRDIVEDKLMELGVERLVLPAVPAVLNTWTASFGFSVVKQSERVNFLDYTFLDFQGTIMCQKILQKTSSPSVVSSVLTEAQQTHFDNTNRKDNVELDENIAVSEVDQGSVEAIKDMYDGDKTRVRTVEGD